ncbi:MAG: bifunctional adenosylcobinamide kinase/adenosylcobinamide-phosphate guanylyltransferase [Tepidimonas sp.]|uniref:bifunctional adenosylcobinamide kinase/adenosylcobinamide-phosphate guanylyltransferase n=1 Tax=Tepidimonas sp. TaxID=2002775 RepID=UPI00298F04C4|nr:bifunctional adenosylcobinamide kinase/adenosylcobinamide-phosphate guanylyltransferase [Tepidimonas sp.]MDW8335912.1 bifunctional adenosylcobinamide kinase/adenosylcobinamide-phosphate guanylyltransferase [Tepidimonas sp.]
MRELVLGGQKSGKSRWAEQRAAQWLAADRRHRALLLATAQPRDAEMRARIERHQRERAARVPGLQTLEVSGTALPEALVRQSSPQALLVIDCLTLWLTQLWWPPAQPGADASVVAGRGAPTGAAAAEAASAALLEALAQVSGPVVLVSHEIGLGVIPLGADVRAFVDTLGQLNQRVAQACERVTLMVAGCALTVKEAA